ncbi:TPA: IS21 family transposase [Citrobacter freundii]|uniref:IS21 family transposase n=2 Tax=Enterobacteriaceae TaxID=543 RepID=A0A9X4GPX1_9ENTR|nr:MULTISPECIES: IS21 family transposase [Enterobacterales]EBF6278450.1 IS21 family transposase [Salmonella enterica subsp. enterica serovar Cubana]EBF6312362.1 IS21 family transposase [Salmonella enterica]EBH9213203.1 IS21 family transposase [Salmonella enterica subsp. enterica serovar Ohio]EDL8306334.1 IS21 family transposase [Salmonella enterica subsp. enterica serovar Senftenberg]EFB1489154.1 IS21 family transposase [Escherichia coli]ELN4158784.1 IS21 family transposase [Citrobacter braak
MSAKRIAMRKIRDVLRLRLQAGLSFRQISLSTKVSVGAIQKLLKTAEQLQLAWPLPDGLDDTQLARLFYPAADTRGSSRFQLPDWPTVHQELKRKGMSMQLLWQEYTERYPNRCYSYSQFCERYRGWCQLQKRSMRQQHKAGEKCFIDYCGPTVPIVSGSTGEIRQAQIFVAVLGASNYTYAEATLTQSLPDWLHSHVRAFEFFGGTPALLVPDNLKSGVNKACRYEPELNPSYQQLAAHYQLAVMPARPYKPKDKAKAEVGVQVVERWILARLRHHTFFSLAELNQCLRALLTELNERPFKQLPGNRRQAFEQLDQPALTPLPQQPYRYVAIKSVKVNIDYHVQFEQHHYSAPHQYVGETLELHAGDQLVQLYFRQQLVASHPRKHQPGTTTLAAHMPVRHSKQQAWTPGRLKQWAQDIGPDTLRWVSDRLAEKAHPEQAYRLCLGLLNLTRSYPPERVNGCCQLANREGLSRLKQLKSVLASNRDQLPEQPSFTLELPQSHDNIRGPNHFH